jgi:hypothetical protein
VSGISLHAILVAKVAEALAAVHAAGIIHRDLKPSNVMIDQRGEPLLMDFGLARPNELLNSSSTASEDEQRNTTSPSGDVDGIRTPLNITRSDALVGTLPYMAPEQFQGQSADELTDVYSLGVLLYECLTGIVPFPGTLSELPTQVREAPLIAPAALNKRVDRKLDSLCRKAIARARTDRYSSAAELASALRSYVGEKNIPPGGRRISWVLLAAMGTAAAVAVLLFLANKLNKPSLRVALTSLIRPADASDKEKSPRMALKSLIQPAGASDKGWKLDRYDLHGTRFYPYPSSRNPGGLHPRVAWTKPGTQVLTGDIDGDGKLEVVVGSGTSVVAYDGVGTERLRIDAAGQLDILADVDRNGCPEIITNASDGDYHELRVYDGLGSLLQVCRVRAPYIETNKFNRRSSVYAWAATDIQLDGAVEILGVLNAEGPLTEPDAAKLASMRGTIAFDYKTGEELWRNTTGPSVSTPTLGVLRRGDAPNVIHGSIAPFNRVRGTGRNGEAVTYDRYSYAFMLLSLRGTTMWLNQTPVSKSQSSEQADRNTYGHVQVAIGDLLGRGNAQIAAGRVSIEFPGDKVTSRPTILHSSICLLDSETGNPDAKCERRFTEIVRLDALADLDGDGRPEILATCGEQYDPAGRVMVLQAAPDLPITYQCTFSGQSPRVLVVNDLDGDQHPEVIAAIGPDSSGSLRGELLILDSQLRPISRWTHLEDPSGSLSKVIVSDVDGDGVNELLFCSFGDVTVLRLGAAE